MNRKKYPMVTVVILNWNGWKDTVECLESLKRIKYPNFTVVVVDNSSKDDSIKKLREYSKGELTVESKFFRTTNKNSPVELLEFHENELSNVGNDYIGALNSFQNKIITLIKNDENHGFAEGNNIGIRFAMQHSDPDYILLLNNDTVVDPEFMTELVKKGESSENIGFVGAKTYFYHDENVLQDAGGGVVDFKHGVVREIGSNSADQGQYNRSVEIDYVGGACLLCKRAVIETVGMLDSNFFMYWEDVNWCLRGYQKGYISAYSHRSMIWHKYGVSSESSFKIYYLNRNRIYVIRQHADRSDKIFFMFYFYGYRLWYESLDYIIKHRNLKKTRCLLMGALDGLRGPK